MKIKAITTRGMPMALLVASSKSKIPNDPKINSSPNNDEILAG